MKQITWEEATNDGECTFGDPKISSLESTSKKWNKQNPLDKGNRFIMKRWETIWGRNPLGTLKGLWPPCFPFVPHFPFKLPAQIDLRAEPKHLEVFDIFPWIPKHPTCKILPFPPGCISSFTHFITSQGSLPLFRGTWEQNITQKWKQHKFVNLAQYKWYWKAKAQPPLPSLLKAEQKQTNTY